MLKNAPMFKRITQLKSARDAAKKPARGRGKPKKKF
jgi:hypothetical protein